MFDCEISNELDLGFSWKPSWRLQETKCIKEVVFIEISIALEEHYHNYQNVDDAELYLKLT